MSYLSYTINNPVDHMTTLLLRSYLSFPEDQPITAVDFRCGEGRFLSELTKKHNAEKYLYGVDEENYNVKYARDRMNFYKVFQSSYKAEAKMSKEAFSLAIIQPKINRILTNEMFESVDQFVEPNYDKQVRMSEEFQNQHDFGNDGLTEEEIAKRKEEVEKKIAQAIKQKRMARRAVIRAQEKKLSLNRDDQFLLVRATERLMPGGILVFVTQKEFIDQFITIRLCNQYEDIRILRADDEQYLKDRKVIIVAKKRRKNLGSKEPGILLAETKLRSYKEIEVLEPQATPSFHVPSRSLDCVEMFRIGPITASEALQSAQRSNLLEHYQKNYSQVLTKDAPIAPAPLKKGHIMLLLTSGYLNGYIGEGPNKHLVKGSATKLSREYEDIDDDGNRTWKEKEYYNISVKYLTRDGEFHKLM